MRIAHIVDTGGLYGKERVILALVKQQVNNGHTVVVFTTGSYDLQSEIIHGNLATSLSFQTYEELSGDLTDYKFDIIHTHGYKSGYYGVLYKWTHPEQKVIRTIHGYTGIGQPWYSKIRLYETADKLLQRFNDTNIAVDATVDVKYRYVIPNGIATVEFHPRNVPSEIIDFTQDSYAICCMARLSSEKNLANLIEAVKQIPDVRLVIFGDGPLKEELTNQAYGYYDRIYLAGFDPLCAKYLPAFDAYIQPSLTEGLPISVLEAMSTGVIPTILTEVGGMVNIAREDGCFITGSSVESIRTSIRYAKNNPGISAEKARKALHLFEARYSDVAMYRNYQHVYETITHKE